MARGIAKPYVTRVYAALFLPTPRPTNRCEEDTESVRSQHRAIESPCRTATIRLKNHPDGAPRG